ncbi:MAG: 16S rRNA (uracil(1498)-N(3))-methyltransferase [Desulfomonile tiedjei]|uniref:Ribosomal RNA small subunit methyltransferase E n=1 Tax=Desulfomonile tiedjei TaxID=2358 RepID=A0A9D6YZX4_9BACT|nr:16S rRNA (uracil(1498)-N(3))-methyltransferase [Desulfomonile tiedjei]
MKTPRIFVQDKEVCGREVVFSEKNSLYLKKVLRLKAGNEVTAFDGTSQHQVKLTSFGRDSVCGLILNSDTAQGEHVNIILAFACLRPGPMQEILRHCTELGVSVFVPLLTVRANRRPHEKKERWESTVAGASAQCGRVTVPRVLAPTSLSEFLRDLEPDQVLLLLSRAGRAVPMWEALKGGLHDGIVILVGPEGGLEDAEEAQAVDSGFLHVSLGPRVLRAETAAIVAAGVIALSSDRAELGAQRE